MTMSPNEANEIVTQISQVFNNLRESYDSTITLLVSPTVRYHISQLVTRKIPDLAVISYSEISDELPVEIIATVNPPKGGHVAA